MSDFRDGVDESHGTGAISHIAHFAFCGMQLHHRTILGCVGWFFSRVAKKKSLERLLGIDGACTWCSIPFSHLIRSQFPWRKTRQGGVEKKWCEYFGVVRPLMLTGDRRSWVCGLLCLVLYVSSWYSLSYNHVAVTLPTFCKSFHSWRFGVDTNGHGTVEKELKWSSWSWCNHLLKKI